MKIGVIGGGSLGLLISSYLANKHSITLYVRRKEQQLALLENKLQLYMESTYKRTVAIQVKNFTQLSDEDCFFICVKQPHIHNVIQSLSQLSPTSRLIFLQNGMGHVEEMKKLMHPTLVGVVEHGAYRMADFQVNHLGKGAITLANVNTNDEALTNIIETLHDEDFPFYQSENWEKLLAEKLIINAIINPLTALYNVNNGEVIQHKKYKKIAQQLCAEVADVLQLCKERSWERIVQVARKTSNNVSSMRADFQQGRQTEIDAILGYIIKIASTPIPLTKKLHKEIVRLQHKGERF